MSENITFKQWVSKAGNKTAGFVSNFADHRSAATHLQSLITSGEFDDEFTADVCKSVLKKGDKAPEFALFFCHHKATFGNGFAKKWAKRDAANDAVSASVGNCLELAKFMFSEFAERRIWKDCVAVQPPSFDCCAVKSGWGTQSPNSGGPYCVKAIAA